MKRLLSILLCFCILLGASPLAFAADQTEGADGPDQYSEERETEAREESDEDPTELTEPRTEEDTTSASESEPTAEETEPQTEETLPEATLPEIEDVTEAYYEDPSESEEPYIDGDTIYDLENEVDAEPLPEELPPEEETLPEEVEEEIYGDESFDAENAEQLEWDYVLDEIIVKFKEPSQVPGKEKQLRHEIEKMAKVGFVEQLDLYVVKVDDLEQNPNAVLNRLKNNKYIEYIEPNYTLEFDYIPNDPRYKTYQSAIMNALNAPEGWDIVKGDDSVTIAVIDSGVASHPDLPPLGGGYSASGLQPSNDRVGHGTNVAGVIGGIGDNGLGGAGINWNANIVSIKADDASGALTVANVAKSIIWAADNGARVINLSLGTSADSATLRSAIDYAYDRGCAIFAATGNAGKDTVEYPARYSNVMAVGSGNATTKSAYSNYGEGLNVVAGSAYYTTTSSSGYTNASGTSFASPQVAGLASLLWAVDPSLSNDEIYSLIEQGASGNGSYNERTGYGMINIGKTLQLAGGVAGSEEPEEPATTPEEPTTEPATTPEEPTTEPATTPVPPETPQETRTPPTIVLTGFSELTLEYGQAYNEMGFTATDCKGIDLTGSVKVTNTVDIWKAGLYTITYAVADSAGLTARATRIVTVNSKPAEAPKQEAPKITIIGSNPIVLHLTSGTAYKEQRARAIDYNGEDISNLVTVTGAVNRNAAGVYALTYSVTSPTSGLSASTTRNVRIVAPTERKDPRTSYGFNGQSKAGGKITHTGIVSGALGFMDLKVTSIDKGMTIAVQLVDTATKKAVLTDTFTAAGTKQYKIDEGKYELVVTVSKANGNSKYAINLLMPETAAIKFFDEEEVPLFGLPQITPIGSNPIILHIGGTPYREQGARAVDHLGNDISDRVVVKGTPDTSTAGTYTVTYTVTSDMGIPVTAVRKVRVLDPSDKTIILEAEVPLADASSAAAGGDTHTVASGDCLWRIAQEHWGDGLRWSEIYEWNKAVIGSDPNLIYPGQQLTLKAS